MEFVRWFLQVKRGNAFLAWGGRNSLPFWKQNELFWDDDVRTAGVGVGSRVGSASSNLTFNAGTVRFPDGWIDFAGNLHVGRVVYTSSSQPFGYTAALGLLRLDGSEKSLQLRNGKRDYAIWMGNLQARAKAGGRPLTLGFGLMHNAEDYSGAGDAYTAANRDQKDGFVISMHRDQTNTKRDWQIGYYYARIETLAVNASFAQDDWVRWGTATQTDASDFKGHELRFVYVPVGKMDAMARLYLVEAITSRQNGRRVRLDANFRF